ncbi:hypothetical protein Acr_23g0018320 [Actinidia rufa]|uniref:Uncharacterized protein n=1 Tax=Actinidia rufa TaxID=165716 RepID=A0A7J0GRL7_9ERIC|nr:hypothetical protein Acr_23g0018320 [Actinidia rufa]
MAKKRAGEGKFRCKNLNPFAIFLHRRDVAKTCFYSTLNLKRLESFRGRNRKTYSMKRKKEDTVRGPGIGQKADSGNKVLPIRDMALNDVKEEYGMEGKREQPKSEKIKRVSRMKELLRWAVAAKSEKGGKYFGRKVQQLRNKAALKAVAGDDQFSNDSPKISFSWDVQSCSTTTSSVYSAISVASSMNDHSTRVLENCSSKLGSWITTDSECKISLSLM